MSDRRLSLLALGGITALGSLATHMFVPALPAAAADLGVPPPAIQQAISLYLLGLGLGQPFWGPVSDTFDRRLVLAASVLLFLAGTIAAAAAHSLELLLIARLVQGIGGAGTLIACRAIVSAASAPGETGRSLAALTSITLASPALAPLAGSLIAATAGWRSIFVLLSLLAAAGFAWVLRLPPMPSAIGRRGPEAIARTFAGLLGKTRFRTAVGANALLVSSLYIYLAASPFLLHDRFGIGGLKLGFCYSAIAVAMLAGTLVLGRFHRASSSRLPVAGVATIAIASFLLAAGIALPVDSALAIVLPMALLGFGSGMVTPLALAAAIESEPDHAGSAASLFGAIQMLATSALSALVTLFLGGEGGAIAAVAAAGLAGAALSAIALR